ncbi:MAG: low molecular weight protein-tyrosine-phosphatase [Mariprofundales bacterium]|nr:low molecular weight protein-tyrosine-phosphatase [Mariprofundales bacterium]
MSTHDTQPMRVLFVCLGNICRSPLAEVVVRQEARKMGVAEQLQFASAGTGSWHVGSGADPRSAATAQQFGLDLSHHKAQQITADRVAEWQWFIAMDRDNYQQLLTIGVNHEQLLMMRSFESQHPAPDVPDPYYGGPDGFTSMYKMLCQNARPLIESLLARSREL